MTKLEGLNVMTKLEELEERITQLEKQIPFTGTIVPWDTPVAPGPTPDPYLVPGAPCEVFDDCDDEGPSLVYFSMLNKNNKPLFTLWKPKVGEEGDLYDHYRVLGTVWDHAPEWVEWVATDKCGFIAFHESQPFAAGDYWESHGKVRRGVAEDGIDGWQNPPIKRPAWARGKV